MTTSALNLGTKAIVEVVGQSQPWKQQRRNWQRVVLHQTDCQHKLWWIACQILSIAVGQVAAMVLLESWHILT